MADFIPRSDSILVQWLRNYSSTLAIEPESSGISLEQSDEFADAVALFREAYLISTNPATRTRSAVISKNSQRTKAKSIARTLARIIQAHPSVTDDQKLNLGLSVKKEYPRAGGFPSRPPNLSIYPEIKSNRVRVRVTDIDHAGKAKPRGIVGAILFYHVGNRAPEKRSEWKFLQNTTLTDSMINLPSGYPAGSMIWITASWLDTQLNVGPSSNPGYTHLTSLAMPTQSLIRTRAA